MVLYNMGYNAIATINEGTMIPEYIMNYLKSRWQNIYVFFDNDDAGINFAKRVHEKYNLPYFYIPRTYKAKDISDLVAMKGYGYAEELMIKLIGNVKRK